MEAVKIVDDQAGARGRVQFRQLRVPVRTGCYDAIEIRHSPHHGTLPPTRPSKDTARRFPAQAAQRDAGPRRGNAAAVARRLTLVARGFKAWRGPDDRRLIGTACRQRTGPTMPTLLTARSAWPV